MVTSLEPEHLDSYDGVSDLEEAFAEFDSEAISGASLGQVYVAEYGDVPVGDGTAGRTPGAGSAADDGGDAAAEREPRRVAVKVRRPNIESLVEADLRVIKFSLPLLMRFVGDAQSFSLETLADEFATVIREEMDYEREARMLQEIRSNFADERDIRIPRVVEERSTGRVLTMEYVPGTKISDIDAIDDLGVDRSALAETLQRVYLQMIIDDGVFHADPHPGNLAVQDDGTIVFYDFGMSGRVDEFVQDKIVDFYAAIAQQNIDAILDALIEMGTLSPEADRETMAQVMELAIADARGEKVEQYRVQQIVNQVEDTIYEFPLRLPPNLALVLRVATVVEGVCVTLDPEFDFIDVATSYLDEQGYIERGAREFVEDRVDEVNQAVQSVVRVPPKLERTLDRVERDNLAVKARIQDPNGLLDQFARRLIAGLFLTGTTVSTAYLYAQGDYYAAGVAIALTLVTLFLLYRSFRTRKGIRAQPQFTRQSMRQREQGEGGGLMSGGMGAGDVGGDGLSGGGLSGGANGGGGLDGPGGPNRERDRE